MSSGPLEQGEALRRALGAIRELRSKLETVERARREPIAIVGLACRFPGSETPEAFWDHLVAGHNLVTEIPPERTGLRDIYDPDPEAPGRSYIRHGGFLGGLDEFDPQFFGISPREAHGLDPQQRLLLEVTWEALERANIGPDRVAGDRAGVWVGISSSDYLHREVELSGLEGIETYAGTGGMVSLAAGRLAYVLGLHGPAMIVDTACSSSLVSVHLAVQSLRRGECDLALAGGVNVMLSPVTNVFLARAHAASPTGACRTFDAQADGYVRGEGCGMVVLKRVSDAHAAGDRVLAIIRGSAINHDGRSSGLTVPNGSAQQAVVRQALEDAGGIDPASVAFVEAHGTGTPLGDPIELRALAASLTASRPADRPLLTGSVKTNIGHLEPAAGIAALVKVVLALEHGTIPGQLHFSQPNPDVDWARLPIRVVTEPTPWPDLGAPRRAGVSSFGMSGTNAHLVVEEAPAQEAPASRVPRLPQVLCLSARADGALAAMAGRLADRLAAEPGADLARVCAALHLGRAPMAHRAAIVAETLPDLVDRLRIVERRETAAGITIGVAPAARRPKAAFLFSGQGTQYPRMAHQLYETEPVFRAAMDRCDALFASHLERPPLAVLYAPAGESGIERLIDETQYTQPVLFTLEYGLAQLWLSWGIRPAAVMGHSLGEYVAAVVSEVLTLEDAVMLVALRATLMQQLPREGAMAAVELDEAGALAAIAPHAGELSIAAVNGPDTVVLSGHRAPLETLTASLAARGVAVTSLNVSHAFHSPLVAPMLDRFREAVGRVRVSPPRIPLVSNVTGRVASAEELAAPSYWVRHVREAVRFGDGMTTLSEMGVRVFVELGPASTLLGLGRRSLPGEGFAWVPSLGKGKGGDAAIASALGRLFVEGAAVDWSAVHAGIDRRVSLPTYPFQRTRFWMTESSARTARTPVEPWLRPLLERRVYNVGDAGPRFETRLSAAHPARLSEHRVFGATIAPATAYMEMAFEAADVLGLADAAVANLAIAAPLTIPGDGEVLVQTLVEGHGDERAFTIHSYDASRDAWIQHASGRLREPWVANDAEDAADRESIVEARDRCRQERAVAPFYDRLAGIGVAYGRTFRGVTALWSGDGEAVGFVELPVDVNGSGYRVHPALLDSCLHVLDAAAVAADERLFVPVGAEAVRILQPSVTRMWCHGSLRSTRGDDHATGEIRLYNEQGAWIGEVRGLALRRLRRELLGAEADRQVESACYRLAWEPQAGSASSSAISSCAIVADAAQEGEALARELRSSGVTAWVLPDGGVRDGVLDFANQRDLEQALSGLPAVPDAVVCAFTSPLTAVGVPSASQRGFSGRAIALARWATGQGGPNQRAPRLYFVTREGQAVGPHEGARPDLAAIWGVGRSVALEAESVRCTCLDIDGTPDAMRQVAAEVLSASDEDQVALRVGRRFVARLAPLTLRSAPTSARQLVSEGAGFDGLTLQPLERRAPGPGEVEVRVRATGLNFRDVLNALGLYPGPPVPLGNECAGSVVAVGPGVTSVVPGDSVIVMTSGAFRSHVTAGAPFVFRKPARLSFEQAASVPTIYMTAEWGLRRLANVQPGQRVLIPSAAGGVGVAAIHTAHALDAEVIALAGSAEKRAYVRSLGVTHVFDSRSLDFVEEVRRATNGDGVHVVLNSLTGEFIPALVSVLAPHGVFLEIGKRGIWSPEQMRAAHPTASYHVYDAGLELTQRHEEMAALFDGVLQRLQDGSLAPPPVAVFGIDQAPAAFQHMAQARHIGKIVLSSGDFGERREVAIRADKGYLVTGGTGALGLAVARWLVERGARHVGLMSRRGASDEARDQIATLAARGADIRVILGDVGSEADVRRALAELGAPVCGVVHAAGVTADAALGNLTWEAVTQVLQPKADGAWRLDRLTRGSDLDFLVFFSSVSGLLGAPGQANYAAANAYLDGLAAERRAMGETALSINWGMWAGDGMGAQVPEAVRRAWERQGVRPIAPEQGLRAMQMLIEAGVGQAAFLPLDWERASSDTRQSRRPVFQAVLGARGRRDAGDGSSILERLLSADEGDRLAIAIAAVGENVKAVLGLGSADAIGPDDLLGDVGLDSLMVMQLQGRLRAQFGVEIAVADLFRHATVRQMAGLVCDAVSVVALAAGTVEDEENRDEVVF